jgi:NitT/TauT family transport system ATP-binding protein
VYRDGTRSITALHDVSLTICAGSFVTVVGHSGSGKTTLLNLISGLIAPTSGEVYVEGEPVRGPSPHCGMVFQDFSLFPWRTVLGNVAYPLEIRGWSRSKARAEAMRLVRTVGLEDAADRLPKALSGGMKQRTALARCLVYDPAILLLDEPFSSLDLDTRRVLQNELLGIYQASKKTIVLVTHSLEEACMLGQRIVTVTSRGNTIHSVHDIASGYPRNLESDELISLRETIRRELDREPGATRPT